MKYTIIILKNLDICYIFESFEWRNDFFMWFISKNFYKPKWQRMYLQ